MQIRDLCSGLEFANREKKSALFFQALQFQNLGVKGKFSSSYLM